MVESWLPLANMDDEGFPIALGVIWHRLCTPCLWPCSDLIGCSSCLFAVLSPGVKVPHPRGGAGGSRVGDRSHNLWGGDDAFLREW